VSNDLLDLMLDSYRADACQLEAKRSRNRRKKRKDARGERI
jgi:hypothetical protein